MNDPQTRVAVVMALMRELQEVMRAETVLLREMRLARLQELQAEKAALAASYELELRRLRQAPDVLGALAPEQRLLLETAMQEFQAAVRGNAEHLLQARQVAEGIARALGDGIAGASATAGYGAGQRPSAESSASRVIAVAFDRRC